MLMALTGTPEAEKEYIFTTLLETGLSYKLVNANSPLLRKKLAECYSRIEHMVEKVKCEDLYTADDLIKKIINKESDFWISTDGDDNIMGCLIIGFGQMPRGKGICAEAIEGKFDFYKLVPMLEKYYKKLGFNFFEMSGRKGWEKIMKPLGYEFKTITLRKKL